MCWLRGAPPSQLPGNHRSPEDSTTLPTASDRGQDQGPRNPAGEEGPRQQGQGLVGNSPHADPTQISELSPGERGIPLQ